MHHVADDRWNYSGSSARQATAALSPVTGIVESGNGGKAVFHTEHHEINRILTAGGTAENEHCASAQFIRAFCLDDAGGSVGPAG